MALDAYLREVLQVLTTHASMDQSAGKGLKLVQTFLNVEVFVDCVRPPPPDDQHYVELLAFRYDH